MLCSLGTDSSFRYLSRVFLLVCSLSFVFQFALFCFSTCAFFNFLSFACQVCFSVVWLFYFAIRHFFIFSVISVLSFANLHINNVICKLICCFLTANPDRCFVVICLLFSLFSLYFLSSSYKTSSPSRISSPSTPISPLEWSFVRAHTPARFARIIKCNAPISPL